MSELQLVGADALLVAAGIDDRDPHFVLSPLTPAQVAELRRRFSPSRDRVEPRARRRRASAG